MVAGLASSMPRGTCSRLEERADSRGAPEHNDWATKAEIQTRLFRRMRFDFIALFSPARAGDTKLTYGAGDQLDGRDKIANLEFW